MSSQPKTSIPRANDALAAGREHTLQLRIIFPAHTGENCDFSSLREPTHVHTRRLARQKKTAREMDGKPRERERAREREREKERESERESERERQTSPRKKATRKALSRACARAGDKRRP